MRAENRGPSRRRQDRDAEAVREGVLGEGLGQRPGGHDAAGSQQEHVAEPGRDLLDVMGHQHRGWGRRVDRQRSEALDEILPGRDVEAGGRLVEQQQARVAHERPRELDPLALSGRERPEAPLGHGRHAQAVEQVRRPRPVGRRVLVPPRFERGVAGGHHDLAGAQIGPEEVGQRLAGQPDAGP